MTPHYTLMSCNGYQWIERPSGQSRICRDFHYRVETEAIVEELNVLVDRIKRLEEAGDALCAAAAFMGWHMEIEKWNKSKEAKP